MTDKAKKKEEAKKEIRSLLLSAPLGLTITELKRDFAEFIGCPLPWKELGYSSPEDFVQSIPDTVKVTWSNTGMVLTGVANSSTKHIEKMVQCQKVNSKVKRKVMDRRSRQAMPLMGRRGGGGDYNGWGLNRSNYRPHFNHDITVYQPHHNHNLPPRWQYQQHHPRPRARHMAPPSIPAFIRGQISQLLSQHPQGLPLTHFCSIFRSRFGVPLDFREMGFSTEQDLLASLRDIVGMRTLTGGETRVMSLQACVAWDQAKLRGDAVNSSNSQGRNFHGNRRTLLPLSSNVADFMPLLSQNNTPAQPEEHVKSKGRGRGAIRKDVSPSASNANKQDETTGQREEQMSPTGSSVIDAEDHCNIPFNVQNEIRQIMCKRPKGVCASRLPFEYKDMFKKTLPTKVYGYNSVIEFASDLPHIIRVERPHPQGDWHLFPAQHEDEKGDSVTTALAKLKIPSTTAVTSTLNKTPSPPPLEVDKALKESVTQVMSISSEGIPLDKFLETYQAVTGKQLNVTRYGPGGLKRILHSMSDILIISLDASDKAIVLPKMHSAPRRFDQLQDQFQPVVGGRSPSDYMLHLPKDAVSPGCRYRPQALPAAGGYIELFASNILSPEMFWIQLRGYKTTVALEDLMDDLEDVYGNKNLPKEYNMTPRLAQKGMLCAVVFPEDSFWHRGFILGVKDQLYQVYYVDYGNTCCVSIDQMRLLKSKFLKLPAQAIQARLANIKPLGGVWKPTATQLMLTMARDKPLVGLVFSEKDRVLSLCLTDTSKEEDVHFNDMFVEKGYAMFEPESEAIQPAVHEQAPSSLMLYGELPEDEGPQEPGDAAAPRSTQRYIRQAQMMDDLTMNLVNLDGQLYLTSAEISALFFQQDVISSKLQRDNVLIDKVVVYKKSYPDLFSELILYEAPEIDNTADSVNLFPLDRLPLIIDLYSKDNEYEGLKAMALELLEWFDPQDPFWKGDDDSASNASQSHTDADDIDAEEDNQTQSSADDSLPSLDDLQQVLKTLEIKRKRILSRMLSEAPTADCVNELNTVELHISRVEALISKLESESATSSSSSKPLHEKDGPDHSMVSVQSTSLSQRSSLPNTPQTKTTHKVAPMVHTPQEPSKVNPPIQQQAPIESNPPPLLPTLDLKTLLQQQMLMNQMNQLMMQQLGLAPQNASFPGQLPGQLPFPGLPATDPSSAQMLHSFGRGLLPSADADQQQQLLQLQSQLLQQSGGSGIMPGLQNSQLFSQQQGFNSQLPSMNLLASCPPTATATHSVPPGLGMIGVPGLARGRATAPGGRAANSQPQVGAVSPQPGGLQAFLQQPQPNFALSALQKQHQHQHQQ